MVFSPNKVTRLLPYLLFRPISWSIQQAVAIRLQEHWQPTSLLEVVQ